ncbi:MAG: hypothetical protein EP329_27135 [Deltaproteobacteria bacterium]|nr:MAG: hypothetical protein EP329_27135 [Deltaproteobacteria bacterium]
MTTVFTRALAVLSGAAATFASGAAMAAEGGGHGEFGLADGFQIINFVVLLLVLYFWALPRAKDYLVKRHDRAAAELVEAKHLKEEADAKLAEYQRLMTGLEAEVAKIRDEFRADGERERARILAEAEESAARMRTAAQKQIQQETAKLRQELEQEVVAEVLASTEAKVRAQLNAATQRDMANDYIKGLEGLEKLDQFAA